MAHWPTAYPRIVTQPFGPSTITVEPKQFGYKDGGGWLKSYSTAFPGSTPSYDHFHRAVDLRGYEGTPLYAWKAGTVTKVYTSVSGILIVLVRIDTRSAVYGYYHCQRVLVAAGQHVSEGQTIALAGHTGATAAHLHMILQMAEKHSDGVTRTMNYNPLRFLPGGDHELDPRVTIIVGYVTPKGTSANVRPIPGITKPSIGELVAPAKLPYVEIVKGQVIAGNDNWYRVEWKGAWAYLSAAAVK